MKLKVLFVCPTNGLYSPMAEALLRRIDCEHFDATSAGTLCGLLHPLAVEVMNEIGIDLGRTAPRSVQELEDDDFDYVITLGERATKHGRDFTRAEKIHWKLDDLIAIPNDPEIQLRAFRLVRDQIAQRLNLFVLVLVRTRPAGPRPTLARAQVAP